MSKDELSTAIDEYRLIMEGVVKYAAYKCKRAEIEKLAMLKRLHANEIVIKGNETAEQPPIPDEVELKIGLPLALAMECGGDPFPTEWRRMDDELSFSDLSDRIYTTIKQRHDSFVALFPTDATDYGWAAIEEAARAFATFLDGLPLKKKHRRNIKHIQYKVALAILERLNCPKDRKTLQRWINGQNTPEDFTPECMATVQAFSEWARIYTNREQAKINTNNALRIDNPDNRKMERFR